MHVEQQETRIAMNHFLAEEYDFGFWASGCGSSRWPLKRLIFRLLGGSIIVNPSDITIQEYLKKRCCLLRVIGES